MRRSDIDKSSYFWATNCGTCHPGGGPTEYDRKGNRYEEYAKDPKNYIEPMGDNYLDGDYYLSDWAKSGVSEADCLICHLKGYDWKARSLAIRGGHLFVAPTIGAGWFKDLKKSTTPLPEIPDKAFSFKVDYSQAKIVDSENLADRISKKVPDKNCWNCHKSPDLKKRGRSWSSKTDIHKDKGLTCIYCHPAGEDHEIAKGDALLGSVRDDVDNSMKGCADCHLKNADPKAPKAEHSFPEVHLEKITCESCHIPHKDEPALAAIDNATTGKTIGYKTNKFNSGDPLDPTRIRSEVPKTRWYPAFVWYKGKIKPVDPMLTVWWGDWDRASHRVIPIFLWRIRDFTGASLKNKFTVTNAGLLNALKGSKAVNTLSEIETYLRSFAKATDRYGAPIVSHIPVLVKGGSIYYLEKNQLRVGPMPEHEGGFTCCEPFTLSHNIVNGKHALGASGCKECHTRPSPFFNRKILKDPVGEDGKPVYQEAWQLLGYPKEEMQKLTKEVQQ